MAQAGLIGGRKLPSTYVAQINARTPYLSALYSQKDADKFRESQQDIAEANLDLAEDAAKQARKRDKLAQNLGYAGLGLGTAFGLAKNWDAISDIGSSVSSGVGDFVSDLFTPEEALPSAAGAAIGFGLDDIGSGALDSLFEGFDFFM